MFPNFPTKSPFPAIFNSFVTIFLVRTVFAPKKKQQSMANSISSLLANLPPPTQIFEF